MAGRIWTDKELKILDNEWGITPVDKLSKKLNRTPNAVRRKAYDLGKVAFFESGDYIRLQDFANSLGYHRDTLLRKRKYGIPIRKMKSNKTNYYVINIDKFWKWAKNNQDRLDFSRFKKFEFGAEPSWVDNKRKLDKELNRGHAKKWSKVDEARLKKMAESGEYNLNDLALYFKRTKRAVYQRIRNLGIDAENIFFSENSHNPYSCEEVFKIEKAILESECFEQLTRKISSRSADSMKSFMRRRYGTTSIDEIKEMLKEQSKVS